MKVFNLTYLLRWLAVIINEHLMEALRRLRRNSSDTNVDRRLVTNILLQFLTTPRADAKRFEMLSLLATILSWTDPEREKAGLQRAQPAATPPSSFWGRTSVGNSPSKGAELEKTDETEVSILFNCNSMSPETDFPLSSHFPACGLNFSLLRLLRANRHLPRALLHRGIIRLCRGPLLWVHIL